MTTDKQENKDNNISTNFQAKLAQFEVFIQTLKLLSSAKQIILIAKYFSKATRIEMVNTV